MRYGLTYLFFSRISDVTLFKKTHNVVHINLIQQGSHFTKCTLKKPKHDLTSRISKVRRNSTVWVSYPSLEISLRLNNRNRIYSPRVAPLIYTQKSPLLYWFNTFWFLQRTSNLSYYNLTISLLRNTGYRSPSWIPRLDYSPHRKSLWSLLTSTIS